MSTASTRFCFFWSDCFDYPPTLRSFNSGIRQYGDVMKKEVIHNSSDVPLMVLILQPFWFSACSNEILAEYVAVIEATKEIMWLQSFLQELGHAKGKSVLYCESKSAIDLAKNLVYHARTKHIHRRYHFIRSALEDELFVLEKNSGCKSLADKQMKVVSCENFEVVCNLSWFVGVTKRKDLLH